MLLSGMSTMRCDAARRRGAGGEGEALPLGSSGLVDVDVGVHKARQDDSLTHVVDLAVRAWRLVIGDAGDRSVRDEDRTGANAVRRHDSPAEDRKVGPCHITARPGSALS